MFSRACLERRSWVGLLAALSLGGGGGCAGALRADPGPELGVRKGSPLEADIGAGFRAYKTTLERWGRWSADPLYAVRWCPRGVDATTFVPYRSTGHWGAVEEGAAKSAPPGAPYWVSDDSETWGDITMHHGWWVHLDESGPAGIWCWIPGAEATVARVVWRVGDGFVGWAPEPPSDGDGDPGDDETLAWTFVLVGQLLDAALDDHVLTGDASATAFHATEGGRRAAGLPWTPRRVGPSTEQIADSRKALSGYVLAHPTVTSAIEVSPAPKSVASASTPSGAVASSGTSTSSSSGLEGHVVVEALPPGMALYEQMMHDPLLNAGGLPGSPFLPFVGLSHRITGGAGAGYVATPGAKPAVSTGSPPAAHASGHGSSGHASSSSSSSTSGKHGR